MNMQVREVTTRLVLLWFLLLNLTHSFALNSRPSPLKQQIIPSVPAVPVRPVTTTQLSSLPSPLIGGVNSMASTILSTLEVGPYGVLGLSAVSFLVVLPLTLYKKLWGISVAYGFSVCAIGLTLLKLFSSVHPESTASVLVKACIFYGVRLGAFLLLREQTRQEQQPSSASSNSSMNNGSIVSRLNFSLSLSLFYGFLTTPALYAMRHPSSSIISKVGASVAWLGAIIEAIADGQKYAVKQTNPGVEKFVGPTSLTYQISRHPNYLGEVMFWTGLFVGGIPSFGTSIPAWLCSCLGLSGIWTIMLKATSRLEKKQSEKYNGQPMYEKWKKEVKSPLLPSI